MPERIECTECTYSNRPTQKDWHRCRLQSEAILLAPCVELHTSLLGQQIPWNRYLWQRVRNHNSSPTAFLISSSALIQARRYPCESASRPRISCRRRFAVDGSLRFRRYTFCKNQRALSLHDGKGLAHQPHLLLRRRVLSHLAELPPSDR